MSQTEQLTGIGFALAVHGGAGTIPRDEAKLSRTASYHDGLRRALMAGRDILGTGGSALEAVTEAVAALEDDPLFNAGRGSVFTRAGTQEMDACVMDGTNRRAGAVAGVFGPRNPVRAARAVMERSRHVLLIGAGALAFCRENGVAFCEPDYFRTEARRRELQRALEHPGREPPQYGTVGAVARDCRGNLAAATSTGGLTG
jgi:beta-aspartyl-peptidase (threonine type)